MQRVFSTATLPPRKIEAFFQVAALDEERTAVFHERTVQRNIQYSVVKVQAKPSKEKKAKDAKVCKVVQK